MIIISTLAFAIPLTFVFYFFVRGLVIAFRINEKLKFPKFVKAIGKFIIIISLFLISCVSVLFWQFRGSGNYEKDPGSDEFYRTPLIYPFQLSVFGDWDKACLSIWDSTNSGGECLFPNISEGAISENLFIGKVENSYILYNLKTKTSTELKSLDSLKIEFSKEGKSFPKLKTVEKFHHDYWETH